MLDKGLTGEELSCIMVVKGSFFGMGYLPRNFDTISQEAISSYIQPYKDNSFIRTLLNSYASNNPGLVREIVE